MTFHQIPYRHTYLPPLYRRNITWFLNRIVYYEKKSCPFPEAIDYAIDDCLTEGIFFPLFMYRRFEVRELLLRQFPVRFTHYLWHSSSHHPE